MGTNANPSHIMTLEQSVRHHENYEVKDRLVYQKYNSNDSFNGRNGYDRYNNSKSIISSRTNSRSRSRSISRSRENDYEKYSNSKSKISPTTNPKSQLKSRSIEQNDKHHEHNHVKDRFGYRISHSDERSNSKNIYERCENHRGIIHSDASSKLASNNIRVEQKGNNSRDRNAEMAYNSKQLVCYRCKEKQEKNNIYGTCFIQWRFSTPEDLFHQRKFCR